MNLRKIENTPIIGDIFYILIGVILALIFYQVLGIALQTSEPLVDVVSESMYPTLHRGDMLILKGVNQNSITTGMVVVYNHPDLNKLIVHRVYEVNDDGTFITKGDNMQTNSRPDPWVVQPEWIKGEMLYRLPYLGYPRIILENLIG